MNLIAIQYALALLFGSLLLSACSLTPARQPPELGAAECAQATPAEMESCWQNRWQAADAALNQTYKNLQKQLPAAKSQALRQAQRLWLSYRDLHCAQQIAEQQAQRQQAIKQACLAHLTQERTATLANYTAADAQPTADYAATDQRLNQLYRQHMHSASAAQQTSLRQAQRAWLAFRNAECGTNPSCLARLTQNRNAHLQSDVLLTTTVPSALETVADMQLIGIWQRLDTHGDLRLSFGIRQGVHYFAAQLEQLPHEAGQWQLQQGRLSITDSQRRLLHEYQLEALTQGTLTLRNLDGEVERYRKLDEQASP